MYYWPGLQTRVTFMRIRIQLFICMRIPLFTWMRIRIRILFLITVTRFLYHPVLHFEPPASIVSVHGLRGSMLSLKALKFFYLKAVPDLAFHCSVDPDQIQLLKRMWIYACQSATLLLNLYYVTKIGWNVWELLVWRSVISTIIINLVPRGKAPPNFTSTAKIRASLFRFIPHFSLPLVLAKIAFNIP